MTQEAFGPYRIEQLLGRGGMGEVHRAYDTVHDRFVALKRLSPAHHGDREYRARFRREAQIVARLREPHVIPIHAYGEIDDRLYLDMRLVEGADLSDVIRERAIEPSRAVRIVEQVASALDAAHADGLVHRDVKPSNVLVTSGDFVYLVDFGIARSVSPTATGLTASGSVVGTLDYMAPERFESGPVDGRADVYALAGVLFACVTGRRPFTADGTAAQIWAHLKEPPPRASLVNPAVPRALDDVIARGMAKNPADRYATAGELARAAAQALASAPATPPAGQFGPATPTTPLAAHQAPQPPPQPRTAATEIVRPPKRNAEPGTATPALIAGGLAVAVLVIVTAVVFSNGDRTRGSGTTSTSTTTTTSSSTPTTTSTTRSPEVEKLLAALPDVYKTSAECVPSTPDGGAVAVVRCTKPGAWSPRYPAPDESEFRLFGDRAGQDAFFQALVTSRGIPRMDERGGCRPESDPIHYALYYRDTSGPLPGEFTTCFVADGNAQVWWVDTRTLTIGVVKRPGDLKTLDSLDLWWNTTILSAL
ncbi:serine/threonine-protein kinase [Lentzea aerocolonigenes]|uniref:serine/threonine-protein kinase n=1 Tax=Lentzea aerocolonigenes TaxID=68170 RepID=UPI0004C46C12|nr:serine/threonine-protein kinase [Lentzea aerocolonigenes]MCP2241945.1 serine/threonine protein kinase [Lentzea aerocolonigenes]